MEPFEEEDLLLYLYKECPKATSDAIHTALEEGNYVLEEQLKTLRRSIAPAKCIGAQKAVPFFIKSG